MASSSSLLIGSIAVVVVLILITPHVSAANSRKTLLHRHQQHKSSSKGMGFRVELRHVDHAMNLSHSQRLQRAVLRAKHRVEKLSLLGLAGVDTAVDTTGDSSPATVKSPIHPGNGEFLMNLAIGTPPLPYSAIIDTGSDLIWTQCKPCIQCYNQPTPVFNPSNSSTFRHLPCNSDLCNALPTTDCSSSSSDCSYSYQYGDYSSTEGTLSSETFTFSTVSVPGVAFGCGDDNEGTGFNQSAGLVGLGRGALSLVSQLDEPKFSYCLTSSVSGSNKGAVLLMGSEAETTSSAQRAVVSTPLAKNPAQPSFYYINLEGISVGGSRLAIPKSAFALGDDGSGGMIIDSGTTITYLEERAFEAVKNEFVKKTKMAVSDEGSEKTGLDLCFEAAKGADEVEVPAMVFHFEGGDLELPAENYMVGEEEEGVVCLAMGGAAGMSIFGNIQQQNMLVLHDLRKETLSFTPMQCGDLGLL